MRVGILGIGAIGGLVSSLICTYTDSRVLLHVQAHHVESLQMLGLKLEIPSHRCEGRIEPGTINVDSGRFTISKTTDSVPNEWENNCDLVLVCTKSGATAAVASMASNLLSDQGYCLSLQNGIGNEEVLASRLGLRRMLGAVITHGATRNGENSVLWAGDGDLRFGPLPASEIRSDTMEDIASLFDISGLSPLIVDDARVQIWSKLAINAAVNPLAAICGVRNGALLEGELFERSTASLLEVTAVARAEGITLPSDIDMISYLRDVLINTADNRCSMLQDVMAGNVTESASISGEIVQRGEEAGVPTPVNATLHALVQGITKSQSSD